MARLAAALGSVLLLAACGQGWGTRPSSQGPVGAIDTTFALDGGGCSSDSPSALMGCVEVERLEADVRALAADTSPQAVAEKCEQRLREHGFEVERVDYGSGSNVIGTKPGFSKADELVVVSAHHDRKPDCAGADDNISGVAALLEIAKVVASARFDRSLLLACWDEQEKGQLGSAAFARAARARGDRIVDVMVLDAVGYASSEPGSQRIPKDFEQAFPDQALRLLDNDYRGDFLTIVTGKGAKSLADALEARGAEVSLDVEVLTLTVRQKKKLADFHRSDQLSFWAVEYPALLATDTGSYRNPGYHCAQGPDEPDTLDYAFLAKVTRAALGAIADRLELR